MNQIGNMIYNATHDDITNLIIICRKCFPKSVRWNGLMLWSKRWWERIIDAEIAEVLIIQTDKKILSFVVLIKDAIQFEGYLAEHHIPAYIKVISLVSCINLVAYQFLKKIKFIFFNDLKIFNYEEYDFRNSTWILLIATDPAFQHKGLGLQLLNCCEDITKNLNKSSISLKVEFHNKQAMKCYERSGYAKIKKVSDGYYYTKVISQ